MYNLKKLLSLTLALTMVLAMAVTAFAFDDVPEDYEYAQAINLSVSLGIVAGMDDDTFDPDSAVTREQFAKFAYVLMTGEDDGAGLYRDGTDPFPDVEAERWSAGYINWAKELGVISGRDTGLFDPTAPVTFAEAAKMYVVALGYDPANYSYPAGFISQAQTLKIFDNVSGYGLYSPASRGQVAQMTFNALYAEAPRLGTYTSAITGSSAAQILIYTPLQAAFDVVEVTAPIVLQGTSTFAMGQTFTGDYQIQLGGYTVTSGTSSVTYGAGTFEYMADVDHLVNQGVSVFYKDMKGTPNGLDVGDVIVDIQAHDTSAVYEFAPNKVSEPVAGNNNQIKFTTTDDVTYTFPWNFGTMANNTDDNIIINTLGEIQGGSTQQVLETEMDNATGYMYYAFDNDGKYGIDVIVVEEAVTAQVAALTDSKVSFTNIDLPTVNNTGNANVTVGLKSIMSNDVYKYEIADDVEVGDWVYVTNRRAYTENNTTEEIWTVELANGLDSALYNKTTNNKHYFDNTAYTNAEGIKNGHYVATSGQNRYVGNTFDVVLNRNGYIAYLEEVIDAGIARNSNYLMITDINQSLTGVSGGNAFYKTTSIDVLYADGTTATLSIPTNLKLGYNNGAAYGIYDTTGVNDKVNNVNVGAVPNTTAVAYATALPATWDHNLETRVLQVGGIYAYNVDGTTVKELLTPDYVASIIAEYDSEAYVAAGTLSYDDNKMLFGGVNSFSGNDIDVYSTVFVEYNVGSGSKYTVLAGDDLEGFATTANWIANEGVSEENYVSVMSIEGAATSAPDKIESTTGLLIGATQSYDVDGYVYEFVAMIDGEKVTLYSEVLSTNNTASFDVITNSTKTGGYRTFTLNSKGLVESVSPAEQLPAGSGNNGIGAVTGTPSAASANKFQTVIINRFTDAGNIVAIDANSGTIPMTYTHSTATSTGNYSITQAALNAPSSFTASVSDNVKYYMVDALPVTTVTDVKNAGTTAIGMSSYGGVISDSVTIETTAQGIVQMIDTSIAQSGSVVYYADVIYGDNASNPEVVAVYYYAHPIIVK